MIANKAEKFKLYFEKKKIFFPETSLKNSFLSKFSKGKILLAI